MTFRHSLVSFLGIVAVVFALSLLFVPQVTHAQDACNTQCSDASGEWGSNCTESECNKLTYAGGFCAYVGAWLTDDVCIEQTSPSLACKSACWGVINCTKAKCEDDTPPGLCEFYDGGLSTADRCLEAGSLTKINILAPDFWASSAAGGTTTALNYNLLDSSIYGGPPPTNLCDYTGRVFIVVIGIAGVLAVLMLVIGGFQFVAGASNPSARSAAKDRITYALIGLLLAVGSWVILNSINEDLVSGCMPPIDVSTVSTPPPPTPAAAPVTALELVDEVVCLVQDLDSPILVKEYLKDYIRAGLTATVDGEDLRCSVNIEYSKNFEVNKLGNTVVTYFFNGLTKHRTIRTGDKAKCDITAPAWPVPMVVWDLYGDPLKSPPVPASGINTVPAAPICP